MSRDFYRIIETDNFGRDYPNEKFVDLPLMSWAHAMYVATAINKVLSGENAPRYWRVVPDGYVLQGGFEA